MTETDHRQLSDEQEAPAALRSHDERTWAALAHACALLNFAVGLGGMIGAAIIWFTKKEESEWIAFHGLQSLAFQAAQLVVVLVVVGGTWVIGFAFSFLTLGFGTLVAVPFMFVTFFLGILIVVGGLVYSLYGAYQVYEGQEFRYLWLGDWIAAQSGETKQAESAQDATGPSPRSRNALVLAAVVAAVLVLCVLCVVAGVVAIGILGGIVYLDSPAFVPMLSPLV